MPAPLLKNYLYCFTLKQGTILIGIVHLFICSITITFCVLALAHALDVQEMVARDSEDALEREAFEDRNSMHLNTRRMELAHINATEKVYVTYSVLGLVAIYLVPIILLLYGALINNRRFMAPWLIVNMIPLGVLICILCFNYDNLLSGMIQIILVFFVAHTNLYSWWVVYSTYRSLDVKKGLTHEIHGAKKKSTLPPAESSKPRSRSATEPYEV